VKDPKAGERWEWQWVFPSKSVGKDPRSDVSTTMIYTHVLNRPGVSVRSPLDG
jgi:hypothetical protein